MGGKREWHVRFDIREGENESASSRHVVYRANPCGEDPRTHPIWLAAEFGEPDMSWPFAGIPEPAEWRKQDATPSHTNIMALPPSILSGYEVHGQSRLICLVVRFKCNDANFLIITRDTVTWVDRNRRWLAITYDTLGVDSGSTIQKALSKAFDTRSYRLEAHRREEAKVQAETAARLERERETEKKQSEEMRAQTERAAALAVDQFVLTF